MEGEGAPGRPWSGLAEGGLGPGGRGESPGFGAVDWVGIPLWLLSSCGALGEPQNSPFLGEGVVLGTSYWVPWGQRERGFL